MFRALPIALLLFLIPAASAHAACGSSSPVYETPSVQVYAKGKRLIACHRATATARTVGVNAPSSAEEWTVVNGVVGGRWLWTSFLGAYTESPDYRADTLTDLRTGKHVTRTLQTYDKSAIAVPVNGALVVADGKGVTAYFIGGRKQKLSSENATAPAAGPGGRVYWRAGDALRTAKLKVPASDAPLALPSAPRVGRCRPHAGASLLLRDGSLVITRVGADTWACAKGAERELGVTSDVTAYGATDGTFVRPGAVGLFDVADGSRSEIEAGAEPAVAGPVAYWLRADGSVESRDLASAVASAASAAPVAPAAPAAPAAPDAPAPCGVAAARAEYETPEVQVYMTAKHRVTACLRATGQTTVVGTRANDGMGTDDNVVVFGAIGGRWLHTEDYTTAAESDDYRMDHLWDLRTGAKISASVEDGGVKAQVVALPGALVAADEDGVRVSFTDGRTKTLDHTPATALGASGSRIYWSNEDGPKTAVLDLPGADPALPLPRARTIGACKPRPGAKLVVRDTMVVVTRSNGVLYGCRLGRTHKIGAPADVTITSDREVAYARGNVFGVFNIVSGKRRQLTGMGAADSWFVLAGGPDGVRVWPDDRRKPETVTRDAGLEVALAEGSLQNVAYWMDAAGQPQRKAIP